MIDVGQILAGLAQKRPVFHSEADFQHALAWEIHEQWPECSMRLEFKPPFLDKTIYVDIWAKRKDVTLAIELKYKTRGLCVTVEGECFDLLDQIARPQGRYDFVKDIQRLEQVVSGQNNIVGYSILLTNDNGYWDPVEEGQFLDDSFRIHEGKILTGKLEWKPKTAEGTKKGREKPIAIGKNYTLSWQDFSEVPNLSLASDHKFRKFRYLLVRVEEGKAT